MKKRQTIKELKRRLDDGATRVVELVSNDIEAMATARPLNVFITECADEAKAAALAIDARRAKGDKRPLDGVTLAIKDNFCVNGIRTTAGSKILENFVPPYESFVTERLWQAGAICLGKANLDQFGMGSSTENSHFGATINPVGARLGLERLTPGGSSGGSAAAVASGCVQASLGTDTGGSIRQPSSFCGLTGMKPTYGLCSRWGIIAYGSSLDQAGVLANGVEDLAQVLEVMMGHDPKDSTSMDVPLPRLVAAAENPQPVKRIALPVEVRAISSSSETNRVWDAAEKLAATLGLEVVEVSMPHLKYALPTYYILALCEASSNLARYDGVRYGHRAANPKDIIDMMERTRAEGFGEEVKRRILTGTYALSSGYYDQYYAKAAKVRRIICEEFRQVFEQADAMFMPTAPSGAFELGSRRADPVEMYLGDIFTVPVNLAGLPALSLPVAKDDRQMPLGLQVIGPRLGDERVVSLARQIEMAS